MTTTAALAYALLVLLLPISALLARKLPLRQWMPMAAAWIGIFVVGFLLIAYFT